MKVQNGREPGCRSGATRDEEAPGIDSGFVCSLVGDKLITNREKIILIILSNSIIIANNITCSPSISFYSYHHYDDKLQNHYSLQ